MGILVCLMSGTAVSIELESIVHKAIEKSLSLKQYEEQLASSGLYINEMVGMFTPYVNLEASYSDIEQVRPSRSHYKTETYSITLTQPIYKPEYWNNYQEARLNQKIMFTNYLQSKNNLVLEVIRRYLALCRLSVKKMVLGKSLQLAHNTNNNQNKLFESGYSSKSSLFETRVEVLKFKSDLVSLNRQLDLEIVKFEHLTGVRLRKTQLPDFSNRGDIKNNKLLKGLSIKEIVNDSLQNNFELKLIQLNRQVGSVNYDRGYEPIKPNLELSWSQNNTVSRRTETTTSLSNAVTLSLSFSFSPVNSYYEIKRREKDLNALQVQEKDKKKELEEQINALFLAMDVSSEQLNRLHELYLEQNKVIQYYQKGFKQKHYSSTRMIEINRKYSDTEQNLWKVYLEILAVKLQLLGVSGKLDNKSISDFSQILATP